MRGRAACGASRSNRVIDLNGVESMAFAA